jgi:predicted ATPase
MAAEVVETETWCEELTRRREFLQTCGVDTWADGTVATRYRFRHALYQDVVYERIPAARQAQLHQRIGTREEVGYGERCGEIAARLAMHFERGQDLAKAVRYHHLAAQQAMRVGISGGHWAPQSWAGIAAAVAPNPD